MVNQYLTGSSPMEIHTTPTEAGSPNKLNVPASKGRYVLQTLSNLYLWMTTPDPLIDFIVHRQPKPFTNFHSVGFGIDRVVHEIIDVEDLIVLGLRRKLNGLDVDDSSSTRVIDQQQCSQLCLLRTVQHLQERRILLVFRCSLNTICTLLHRLDYIFTS